MGLVWGAVFGCGGSELSTFFTTVGVILTSVNKGGAACVVSFHTGDVVVVSISIIVLMTYRERTSADRRVSVTRGLVGAGPSSTLAVLGDVRTSNFGNGSTTECTLLGSVTLSGGYVSAAAFSVLRPTVSCCVGGKAPSRRFQACCCRNEVCRGRNSSSSTVLSFVGTYSLGRTIASSLLLTRAFITRNALCLGRCGAGRFVRGGVTTTGLCKTVNESLLRVGDCAGTVSKCIVLGGGATTSDLVSVYIPLMRGGRSNRTCLFPSLLSCAIRFYAPTSVGSFLSRGRSLSLAGSSGVGFTRNCSGVKSCNGTVGLLSRVAPSHFALSSLGCTSMGVSILRGRNGCRRTLGLCGSCSTVLRHCRGRLLSRSLLFTSGGRRLRVGDLMRVGKESQVVLCTLYNVFKLVVLIN